MSSRSLANTARMLVAPGKGILAADESTPTIAKRLESIGLVSTEAVRRDYRELLFTTPRLGGHISGVILYDETMRQRTADGRPFTEVLRQAGVIPGIKVDAGTTALAGFPGEVVTQGLDGLRERLAEYASLGAQFAKWRAVLHIGIGRPSPTGIEANAHSLARYAALSQEAGLVPIVEPEVMMAGHHSIDRCAEVTGTVLRAVYDHLARHNVFLEGSLLKPNMVLPGADAPVQVGDAMIARRTLAVLREAVPAAVPGIVFLSGGQSDEQATARLDAINRLAPQPWELSFSFGRALQAPVLRAWGGHSASVGATQAALLRRAALNGRARRGTWSHDLEFTPLPVSA